ncbi:hypothetical protein P106B_61 [Rhizobium phage vB_RglS_P106B]|uniref:Uncharacterized protein n=1 Tax=Rhizobium phage vB_RglS_P106B TaxID=1458697 RepID=W6E8N4_9CAUD|nr:hypothetical protein P106B_61 [Rhizobium phage vB_RglS_P106B]AHJ10744.1 hypothetical protein P106B_61 [Rhizobium phage vB_RglS_P106B]
MFYIIDNFSSFQRQGRRGEPQSLHLSGNWENRNHAARFRTQKEADEMLAYWKHNNNFKGRVITYQDALEMGDDD